MPVRNEQGEYVIFTDKPEGNAFAIMGIAADMMRQIHGKDARDKIAEYQNEAMSGDYENLKEVTTRYVPILTFATSSDYEVVAREVNNDE